MRSERGSDLFERILQRGEAAIDELIEAREAESFFLDFKRSSDNGQGRRLSQTDRNNLAKAISGFGNSEGGVLIWGIECSGSGGQADVAGAKIPLRDAAAFRAKLEGAVSGCTVPAHASVVSESIPLDDASRGFVATYIPKSNHVPHQTVPDLRYFMRSGDAFVPVPHSVLAGMFGRRPQPRVFANYVLAVPEAAVGSISVGCGISAYNDGPGIARDLYAVVTVLSMPGPNCDIHFETPDQNNWSGGVAFGVRLSLVSNDGYKVAPDTHVQPIVLHVDLARPFERDLKVEILIGCDGAPPYRDQWVNSRDEIEAAVFAFVSGQEPDPHDAARRLLGVPPERLD